VWNNELISQVFSSGSNTAEAAAAISDAVKIGLTDVGVTQMPHPLLNSQPPFYQLHPCHTANWMGTMLKNVSKESNYLVTWLSFVAPYVGLKLSEKYAIK